MQALNTVTALCRRLLLPPDYNVPPPHRRDLSGVIFEILCFLAVAFAVMYLILLLFLTPKSPHISVQSLSYTAANSSAQPAAWAIRFGIHNPSEKTSIYFKDATFTLFYHDSDSMIFTSAATAFDQGNRQVTAVNFRFPLNFAEFGMTNLRFDVEVEASLCFGRGGCRKKEGEVVVWCNAIDVAVVAGGSAGENGRR